MNQVAACSKLFELKLYQKGMDEKYVNQLASNLRCVVDGGNINNKKGYA